MYLNVFLVTSIIALIARESFQYEGGVRLVDGSYRSEGRLEVFIFNQWFTLCGTTRIPQDAAASVCQQLGYTHVNLTSIR